MKSKLCTQLRDSTSYAVKLGALWNFTITFQSISIVIDITSTSWSDNWLCQMLQ